MQQTYQNSPQTKVGQKNQQLIPKKMIEHYSYVLNDEIGKGFSCVVYKGKNEKTGEVVAIKVRDMKKITNEVERSLLNQEIQAMKLMSSPNIIKMHDCIHTQNNTYLIMEYCNQGDLGKLLMKNGFFPEAEATKILKHIINGFKEQVRKGIIHRDLKPSNIFLKNGVPKIADYGMSKMMDAPKEKIYYNVGTPLYMSPTAISQNRYSAKSDIWSIGIIFYEMLCGHVPWQAGSEKELVNLMIKQPVMFPPQFAISEEAKDLIRQCLTVDEDLRVSLKEIEV